MTRNWKALGLTALLVAAVGTAHGRDDPEKPADVKKQLQDIEGILRAMNQNFERMGRDLKDTGLRGAQATQDIRDLQDRLSRVEQQLRSQQSMLRGLQSATQDLRDLQDRFAALESRPLPDTGARRAFSYTPPQELRDLDERLAAVERRLGNDERRFSFTPEAPRRAGTLRLQNRSAFDATVTVNGNPFVVPAFETRLVRNVPVGTFNYEVSAEGFGVIQPTLRRNLTAGETFIVYVNP
jgi:TolA-binding protein